LTDEALKAEFADLGAVSANIIRRKRNDQSKGFGFVEFATEAQQTVAIDAKHKSKIQDREISVRKAYVRPEPTAPAADAAPAPKSD
jgi:RNA recognition motif-containing protein